MMQVLRVIKLLNDFGSCYFVVEAVQQHQHEPPKKWNKLQNCLGDAQCKRAHYQSEVVKCVGLELLAYFK